MVSRSGNRRKVPMGQVASNSVKLVGSLRRGMATVHAVLVEAVGMATVLPVRADKRIRILDSRKLGRETPHSQARFSISECAISRES